MYYPYLFQIGVYKTTLKEYFLATLRMILIHVPMFYQLKYTHVDGEFSTGPHFGNIVI